MAKTPLQELADHGQSVWIDFLSRTFVKDGDLAGLIKPVSYTHLTLPTTPYV